jgi:hypothetical protein
MPGRGTQTGVEKGTNVARVMKYHQGLRGHTTTKVPIFGRHHLHHIPHTQINQSTMYDTWNR